MKKKLFTLLITYANIILLILATGCTKQDDWLAIKSSKASVVPETMKDYQAILDNTGVMNVGYNTGLIGADNLYVNDNDLSGLPEREKNLYIWNKTIWADGTSAEWSYYYQMVGFANIVLDGLSKIDPASSGYNNLKGQAYFFRAFGYYQLAQLFCKPYDSKTADVDLGLPIRLSSDVTRLEQRSSLKVTYEQIIIDANTATTLLDENQIYLQRANRNASKTLLAKTYLNQEDYNNSLKYAEEVIKSKPALADYNNTAIVSATNAYWFQPLGKGNPEIMYYAEGYGNSAPQNYLGAVGFVTPELYSLYSSNDLRKTVFFGVNGSGFNFVGSYTGKFYNFFGLATNEVYLIRSECYARTGNLTSALADLNLLLINRYKTGTFVPVTAATADAALDIILRERRKELPFVENIRWEDLRRLNKDSRFQKTLTRTYKGVTYSLPPNDPRYVLPIPDQEIQLSGLTQNIR